MAKNKLKGLVLAGGTVASAMAGTAAYAVDVNISGFVRQEIALSVSDEGNPFNTVSNDFMGRVIPNVTNPGVGLSNGGDLTPGGTVFTGKGVPFDNGGFTSPIKGLTATSGAAATGAYVGAMTGRMAGAAAGCLATGTCGNTARGLRDDNTFNLFATRAEIDVMAQWTDQIKTFVKFRAFSDYQEKFNDQIGTPGGHFAADFGFYGQQSGNVLEWNTPSFMLDLPSAYIDYNSGPLWIRVGQQQIAWGEAYFFRVFDVPNGLDTRRHFTLDVAAEEFSDKRVSAPGVRLSYTFANNWELDSFVQMSAPTTIVNTNTPYNVVASGFTWRDNGQSDMLNNVNYGARMMMPLTEKFTMGAMAVNRVNPDGVVAWADAPTTLGDGSPNPFCYGPNNYAGRVLAGLGLTGAFDMNQDGQDDVGQLLTPMKGGKCGANASPDPLGTASYKEWFTYASRSRLNPMEGTLGFLNGGAEKDGTNASTLTTAIFGLAGAGFGDPAGAKMILNNIGGKKNMKTPYTYQANRNILDGFFNGFAFPRGYITRHFFRENVVGLSGNYIVDAEPGTWLDQLIIRAEVSVTPNKRFTPLDLRAGNWIEETDVNSALVLEKYHNVVPGLPATYLVAQWMHRTQSDLFGRHLSGNDHRINDSLLCFPNATEVSQKVTGVDSTGARQKGCGRARGQDGADYLAFAFQQPFPNLIWRADFAMLIDLDGSVLLQPGVKYRPSSKWQLDLYANVLQDFTPKQNNDVIETLDFADEIFARVSYYF